MGDQLLAGEGAIWVQPDGPNTTPYYLGCHTLGDIDEPRGDLNLLYCPDPSQPNLWKVNRSYKSEPGPITTSIEAALQATADYLERVKCPFPMYVHKVTCGRMDVFDSFDRTFILGDVDITSIGLSNLTSRQPGDQEGSLQTFEIAAQSIVRGFKPTLNRVSTAVTESANKIVSAGQGICAGDCGPAEDLCDTLYAICDAAGAATAEVMVSTDRGATWAATSADPFTTDEDIQGLTVVQIDRDTHRVIVGRGSTDAGNACEIAYSDDGGATWTAVDVGSTNGEYVPNGHSIFALDRYHIWVGTDGGYIFFSDDGGATWTAQESAVIHSAAYNAIYFVDESNGWAVGAADVIARTTDGGSTWSQVTATGGANAIQCVLPFNQYRAWVGDAGGDLYYTADGGTTWTQREFSGDGVGAVNDIQAYDEHLLFMVHDNATPVGRILMTINGGYSWLALTTPDNDGINSIHICEPYEAYFVGEAESSTTFVGKAFAAAG
jgi:photosystem II stability/assembly factor-like uncharacterized protein